jgi:hypothetical protein
MGISRVQKPSICYLVLDLFGVHQSNVPKTAIKKEHDELEGENLFLDPKCGYDWSLLPLGRKTMFC